MKKIIFSLLVLLLLLIGSVFLLPIILSSDAAKEQLSKRILSISDMQVALDGPVEFSVFPDLGLVARSVNLTSANQGISISADKIVARVTLSSVLSGNIEFTALSMIQPNFIVDATKQPTNQEPEKATPNNTKDPFVSAIELLEKLSFSRLEIINGKFTSISVEGAETEITNIDTVLLAPSLDGEILVDFSALKDGRQITYIARLAALRPILKRQPSEINIALKVSPPPHPALADLTISGKILLSEDGSYQISDGTLTSLGQPLHLDVLYRPSTRPYVNIAIKANNVDLGLIGKISNSSQAINTNGNKNATSVGASELGILLKMDADIGLVVDRFSMDGAEIRKINLQAKLKDGNLNINLDNAEIAKGSIAANASARLDTPTPSVQGSISATSLNISDLTKLAGTNVPITGALGLNFGYAFTGLDIKSIKKSFNMAGSLSLSNGIATIPALGKLGLGPSSARVSSINLIANIQHAQKPIDIKARMNWNGEAIRLSSLITPHNLINNGSGPLTISIDSNKLVADYSGNISLGGTLEGNAKITTKSLGSLLAWLGQSKNPDLKGFSYAGKIKLNSEKFAFNKARISLNGINANGSGSIGLKGKTSLNSTLAFGTLDIAALTGGSTGAPNSAGTASSGKGNSAVDLSALKKFDANIKLSARKILYGKVKAGPLKTSVVIKNGIATIKLPQTPFYKGSLIANIIADGSKSVAALSVDAKLAGIDALPLFNDAASFKRIEGKLNADLAIHGSGSTTRQMTKSLGGTSSVRFADGAIKGIDIAKIYNNLTAILSGGFKENRGDKTSFTEMGLSFVIDKGVATTKDIKLLGPLVRMDGAGNVNLGQETIDMRLHPRVVASASGQGGEYDVKGLGIPVIVKGPLSKPRVYPDLSELLKNPQAALQTLSKLGLNIKGLDLKKLGKGKLDIAKLAKGKIGIDKLDKIVGKGTSKTVGKVLGGLLANKNASGDNNSGNGTEKVVGALVNQFLNPDGTKEAEQPAANQQPVESKALNVTGQIPVPTPNPRRKAAIAAVPKTVKQVVIEKIAPKIKLPVSDEVKKQGLDLIFDNILKQ